MKAASASMSASFCHCSRPQFTPRCWSWRMGIKSQSLSQFSSRGAVFLGKNMEFKAVARRSSSRSQVVRAVCELSYIMVKPDGVQRGMVGKVITRFEDKGFKLKGLKMFKAPREVVEEHYAELKDRPFFPDLLGYILSGPVVCMVWEGDGVVASARKMIGKTDPLEAEPGTIRGDFAVNKGRNIVHGSDSLENGIRETGLWFDEDEVIEWSPTLEPWILE